MSKNQAANEGIRKDISNRLLAQLKQRFASEVLWHFVGRGKSDHESYQILLSILRTGLKVGEKNEFKFVDPATNEIQTLWGYPVCCLADIPLKDLHIHAERYGRFAIGFHKESAISSNFNPVLYINQYSSVFHHFILRRNEVEGYLERTNSDIAGKFQELLLLLGSVTKSGDLKANPVAALMLDEMQLNNFYYEREWRSIYNWDFQKDDVAILIMPDETLDDFRKDRKRGDLRIDEDTPILPFSMVYRL
ncbi:MAG: hypothetical protein HYY45_03385 [Deltaproteobacteria bacterium]|nr:hypothetical protein [Deltaproteobacteria bacterium]